jgi:hypothetical protein
MVNSPAQLSEKKLHAISGGVAEWAAGDREPLHVHEEDGQLKWPRTVGIVRTPRGVFVVPPSSAVWIPARERHAGLYLEPAREHQSVRV